MGKIEIYTDGGCKGRWGSWAYLLLENDQVVREDSGRMRKTNSNRMEFQAVIEGLRSLPSGSEVIIATDFRPLIENIANLQQWSLEDWKKSDLRPIPNADLLRILHQLLQKHRVAWRWVRAHAGNKYNERCDELCKRHLA